MKKKKKIAAFLLLFAMVSDAGSQAPAAATTPTRTAIEWRNIGLAARGADAVAAFTKAVELQPDIGDWWQRLGDALASTGNHAAAINAFRKANALGVFSAGGTDAKAYRSLAMSQAALGQKDAALRSYEEAVFHASFALAWYNDYRKSLGLEPVTESAAVESRNVTFRREQSSPANLQARIVALCAEAQKLQKQGYDITGGSLGTIVVQKLRDAVSLDPSRAESHALYAEALSRESETEQAVAEFREAIQLAPSIARYHHLLSQTLSANGRSQEAISEERSAIRIEPSVGSYLSLAAAQDRSGDVNGSIDSYTEATKLDPSAAKTHASLAAVLAKGKRPDEAMVEYQHALDLAPNLEPEVRTLLMDSWRKSYNTLRSAAGLSLSLTAAEERKLAEDRDAKATQALVDSSLAILGLAPSPAPAAADPACVLASNNAQRQIETWDAAARRDQGSALRGSQVGVVCGDMRQLYSHRRLLATWFQQLDAAVTNCPALGASANELAAIARRGYAAQLAALAEIKSNFGARCQIIDQ